MADAGNLARLPLEIRNHIYSYAVRDKEEDWSYFYIERYITWDGSQRKDNARRGKHTSRAVARSEARSYQVATTEH